MIYNAKIKYSYLGFDQNGNPIIKVGFITSFGEFSFESYNLNFVRSLIKTLDLQSWEEVPRKYCRIEVNNAKVSSIGNLIEDKWIE